MRSIGLRLLLTVGLPVAVLALVGTVAAWRQTDLAVRERTQADAVGLAEFVATSFSAVDEKNPTGAPRVAHRAVTNVVRSSWASLNVVTELRVVGRDGLVKWSRRIEEEDKPFAEAQRILAVPTGQAAFVGPASLWPWSRGGGGEVLFPVGGVGCGGCHTGESTLRTGVIQLTVDEPALRTRVAQVFAGATWFVALFLVVLGVMLALAVRLLVVDRIARLAGVMRRAERGDLVLRAPDLGEDELGELAKAFNSMLARLTELKVTEIDTQREIEHARVQLTLKKELEHRVHELQSLYELAGSISSTLDLNELLTRITDVVPKRLNVPKFSIMLLNGEGLLEVLKAHPANVGSEGLTFAIGEGICGKAALDRASVYVADLTADTAFRQRGPSNAKGEGSLLAVPLVQGAELLGVLNFERHEKHAFAPADLAFFTAVADQASLAVQNARLHERTVAMSVTDPLTGIPNRRHLFAQLEAELARANRYGTALSLVMIDIDHFKHLNDTAGHRAGDEVLRQVTGLLRGQVRKVDTLARYGGEEFVILLPQVSRAEALEVGEKLRAAVANAPIEQGKTQPSGRVTISVGVATLPVDATEQARLIDCADSALYASKRGGRNTVTGYQSGMELHPGRERGPNAIKRKTGEIPVQRP